jgi:MutS domain V
MPTALTAHVDHEYRSRLEARRAVLAGRERWHVRLSRTRLGIAFAALLMGVLWGLSPGWWYAVPVLAFAVAAVVHARVLDARTRAGRAVTFYERGLARLSHEWMGTGDAGDRYRQPDHPYADDLDLFGRGSAFELLGTSRTQAGQDTLARWLLEPAPPDQVQARQEAVRELGPRLDLRETLALQGDALGAGVDATRLRRWATTPPVLPGATVRLVLAGLAAGVVATGVIAIGQGTPAPGVRLALAALLLLEGLISLGLRPRVKTVMGGVALPAGDLALLAGVLRVIENEPASSRILTRIRQDLGGATRLASAEIARLDQLVGLLHSRTNILFAPVAAAIAWATQVSFAIEAWRARVGPHVPRWLDAVGDFEGLTALSAYAAEHPDGVFPVVGDPAGSSHRFEARQLAHPLLAATAVANDIVLGTDAPHLLVVSGSNMSGKSTLLRAIGLNVVLAQAGAPVRATDLRLSPLAIGASIRIQDSLMDGRSRFLAEILRLKQVVDLTRSHDGALLFLLDEILGGTNSHDRRAGAEAVLAGLIELGAIGLVTTHDLSLGSVADRLAPRAANVHFADAFDGGGLSFDYRLRPGVVRTSNALALMRAIGLDVTTAD